MKKLVTFRLSEHTVHNASGGFVLGDFNNWDTQNGLPLTKTAEGALTASAELEAGKSYQYRYFLHDGRWENDDRAHYYISASGLFVENCVVVVEADEEQVPEHITPEVLPAAETATATEKETVEPAKKTAVAKKTAAAKKPAEIAHDFTKIEGIGKQIQAVLYKHNINTYAKLSKTSIVKLQEMLDAEGSKFSVHQPATWPKQAKLAAAENWEALAELQKTLVGGKKK